MKKCCILLDTFENEIMDISVKNEPAIKVPLDACGYEHMEYGAKTARMMVT